MALFQRYKPTDYGESSRFGGSRRAPRRFAGPYNIVEPIGLYASLAHLRAGGVTKLIREWEHYTCIVFIASVIQFILYSAEQLRFAK